MSNLIFQIAVIVALIVVNVINFKLWRRFRDNTLYVMWSMGVVAADLAVIIGLWLRLTRF